MKILALIPARGGSKRLPGKNIMPLHGRPLIDWSISFALNSKIFDQIIVSSDDPNIIQCAVKSGAKTSGLRPKKLSDDNATSVDVALHELACAERNSGFFDYLVLLQPTTPYRKLEILHQAINILEKNPDVPSVVSVSNVLAKPYHMFTMLENGSIKPLFPDFLKSRTQDLPETFQLNGSLYVVRPNSLKLKRKFYFNDSRAVLCSDVQENIDIDTLSDFKNAERLLEKYKDI